MYISFVRGNIIIPRHSFLLSAIHAESLAAEQTQHNIAEQTQIGNNVTSQTYGLHSVCFILYSSESWTLLTDDLGY